MPIARPAIGVALWTAITHPGINGSPSDKSLAAVVLDHPLLPRFES